VSECFATFRYLEFTFLQFSHHFCCMIIGIDMMGGDYAPLEAVKGVKLFLEGSTKPVTLVLLGDEAVLQPLIAADQIDPSRIKIVHAPQVIEMHEHPTKALREKQQSSIAIGFHLLSSGKIDALISAGNTGAMMVGALFSIKAFPGIQRPTIGTYIPREIGKPPGWLLDAGINADCKPENLVQFAILGSLFVKHVWNIENPRVGLINIGEEEGKGNLLAQAAYPLLKENKQINFIGNIEGRDILSDKADVMVCEGFTGNVILKFAESIYDHTMKRGIKDEYFDLYNFEQYGGVPVLGVAKPVIIGHGISHGPAFKNMISITEKIIEKELMQKIKDSFQEE
jgi:glycerol-3-phosphate acyltransferase PlsX